MEVYKKEKKNIEIEKKKLCKKKLTKRQN